MERLQCTQLLLLMSGHVQCGCSWSFSQADTGLQEQVRISRLNLHARQGEY